LTDSLQKKRERETLNSPLGDSDDGSLCTFWEFSGVSSCLFLYSAHIMHSLGQPEMGGGWVGVGEGNWDTGAYSLQEFEL